MSAVMDNAWQASIVLQEYGVSQHKANNIVQVLMVKELLNREEPEDQDEEDTRRSQ